MVMSWIFTCILVVSLIFSIYFGHSPAAAIVEGAQAGITLSITLAGSLCLWSGVGHLMEKTGATGMLSKLLSPILCRLFPSARQDEQLKGFLSANVTANLLGLGNAATPMGIRAAQRLTNAAAPHRATAEQCRLIVLNTASIQLIPTNVAALRSTLGCAEPFDILPAVWVTSLLSAGLGVGAAILLERVFRHA